jgi:hypothetical protein
MAPYHLRDTAGMLRALIAGASCERIAEDHGITKSAVSQRVRALANDLQQIVGVMDVDENESPTAALIRHHGDAYLEALEHFVPDAASTWRGQVIELATCRLAQHLTKIARHSRCVERDSALLLILFSTAAKPLEIAQLEVRDYLNEFGAVRQQSNMRADIAVNGKERPLLFCDPALIAAIDTYLVLRRSEGMAIHEESSYRGLRPQSRLFLTRTGEPMAMKRSGPGSKHLVCKEIHEIYRRIFALDGHSGINTGMARRLAAHRLHMDGANAEEIGAALGVKKLAVYKLLRSIDGEPRSSPYRPNGTIDLAASQKVGPAIWQTA